MTRRRLTVRRASSVPQAVDLALEQIEEWAWSPAYCWFRGTRDRTLGLQPGACWRRVRDERAKKAYPFDEREALFGFLQKGAMFGDVHEVLNWHTYYLAQHHRVPTRLMDWTESFAAALFFAFDGWDGKTDPCVWILQPSLLNETFLDWYGVLDPGNIPEAEAWLPRPISRPRKTQKQDEEGYVYDNDWPLAITPRWTNSRIISQQGMFTVHGPRSAAGAARRPHRAEGQARRRSSVPDRPRRLRSRARPLRAQHARHHAQRDLSRPGQPGPAARGRAGLVGRPPTPSGRSTAGVRRGR